MNRISAALNTFQRESEKGYICSTTWFLRRFYYRYLKRHCQSSGNGSPGDSKQAITVVVPVVDKDAPVLVHSLRSIREMIRHDLVEIWVVAPESAVIREIAKSQKCEFVHEDAILPRPASELKCRGWVLQQFIKLSAAKSVTTPNYLVVDADTVFLRPQSFFKGGKSVIRYSDQYELLYKRSLELVLDTSRRFPVSFVTHHMLFNAEFVQALLILIERKFDCPWWEAILKEVDYGHLISFSEYELYGHFVIAQANWKEKCLLEYWHGLDRRGEDLPKLETIRRAASARLNTVSFHWHTQ
jgi:hypothetical protein